MASQCSEFVHLSVMPDEVLQYLAPADGGIYLDGTLGGAGHSRLILEACGPTGRLIGLDQDPAALAKAARVLAPYGDRVSLVHSNFSRAASVLASLGISGVDGMLLDLGVSSHQLDSFERGFSFREDAPLDMRMDPSSEQPRAAELLAELDEQELADVFFELGEERFSRRIARRIVARRAEDPVRTTLQLANLVAESVPVPRGGHRIHPATRVFQALRIRVNDELGVLKQVLADAFELLNVGGRLVVISFHSLEDRMVKNSFRREASSCICPPRMPRCVCGHSPKVKLLTRKGVRAADQESRENPRARSAVLRAVERL